MFAFHCFSLVYYYFHLVLLLFALHLTSSSARLSGEFRYYTNEVNARDRRLAAGEVSLFVGPPIGTSANGDTDGYYNSSKFKSPTGSTFSSDNSYLLVADYGNNKIRKVVVSTKMVSTFVGPPQGTSTSGTTNGVGTNARFTGPAGIQLSLDDTFALVAENSGRTIRKIEMSSLSVTKIAGSGTSGSANGQGTSAQFNSPVGICINSDSSFALITDAGANRIRKLVISTAQVTLFAGSTSGLSNGEGTNSQFSTPYGIALSSDDTFALVIDLSNKFIRKIVISTAMVTTLAGSTTAIGGSDGIGTNALLYSPQGIDISSDSSYALFTSASHTVRQLILSTNEVITITGQHLSSGDVVGTGTNAKFSNPFSVGISSDMTWFVVVEYGSNKLKMMEAPFSIISTSSPTTPPTTSPSLVPSTIPSLTPSSVPSSSPSSSPSSDPSFPPTNHPSAAPALSSSPSSPSSSSSPSSIPSSSPSSIPSSSPSSSSLSSSVPTSTNPSPSSVPTSTLPAVPHQSSQSNEPQKFLTNGALIGMIVGIVVGFILICCGGIYFLFVRANRSNTKVLPTNSSKYQVNEPN